LKLAKKAGVARTAQRLNYRWIIPWFLIHNTGKIIFLSSDFAEESSGHCY